MYGTSIRQVVLPMCVSALLAGAPAALAQSGEADQTAAAPPPPEGTLIEKQDQQQMLADDLVGMDVQHPEEGSIGSLDSLLFDDEDRIVGGVVSVGGFLGFGAKSVALSWDAFDVRRGEGVAYVDLTREQLEAAPSFRDLATQQAEAEAERARQMQQQSTGSGTLAQ